MLMDIEQSELYATIQTRIRKTDVHADPSLFLLAVLFCLLQVLPPGTGMPQSMNNN
jgi:hypothetical protein